MEKQLCLYLLLVLFTQCVHKSKPSISPKESDTELLSEKKVVEDTTVYRIDVNKEYPKKNLFLQEICDTIEYILLETTPESLLPDAKFTDQILLTDNDIFISIKSDVYRFAREGKFLNKIGKKGSGPKEYTHVFTIAVDETNKQVLVHDPMISKILFYDYNSNFIREVYLENASHIALLSSGELFCYAPHRPNIAGFYLADTESGETIKELSIPYPKSINNLRTYVSSRNPIINGNNIFFNTYATDTIFYANQEEFKYRYLLLPPYTSKSESTKNTCIPILRFETDYYSSITIYKPSSSSSSISSQLHYFIINKIDKEIINGMIADLETSLLFEGMNTGKRNTVAILYDIDRLHERAESGYISGKMKEIVENSNIEDNPVLMIATFKD